MNDPILYTPRSGDEVTNACRSKPPIYLYSTLVEVMRRFGPLHVLKTMMRKNRDAVILIQDPKKMNSGHWTSLSFHPEKREIYFFSSYGGKPDEEKNLWLSNDGLIRSNQDLNVLNDGLKALAKKGWEIHYNNIPYQKVGDKTATCGIWVAGFLNFGGNPDEFYEYVRHAPLDPHILYRLFFH